MLMKHAPVIFPKQEDRKKIAIVLLFTQTLKDLGFIHTKTVSEDKYLAGR